MPRLLKLATLASLPLAVVAAASAGSEGGTTFQVSFIARSSPNGYKPAVVCTETAGGSRRTLKVIGAWREFDWRPSGRRIAVVAVGRKKWSLELMNQDGERRIRVALGRSSPTLSPGEPKWSPNGKLLAYTADRGLYVATPEGRSRRLLPAPQNELSGYSEPAWSQDGKRLYFVSWSLGPARKTLMSIDPIQGGRPRVESAKGEDISGVWSPDRRSRAYVTREGELEIARSDGTRQRIASSTPWPAEDPSWSPDGTTLSYLRRPATLGGEPKRAADVFATDVATGAERRITASRYDELAPSWQRLRASFGSCRAP